MYRLLIADDEALEREGLEWIVQRMMPDTFQIIHAENGRAAIERAEEYRPHIVFMDVNMPGIKGLEALREIKARLPETKLVLVTAYDYFAYAKEALSLGVKDYILKPAKREQIVAALRLLVDELELEKSRRQDELELKDKLSQLQPLVENELAMMLMIDAVMDADASRLAEWLDFPLDRGSAFVVAFPEQSDPADQKKMYDAIRGFAKTQGSACIVSSAIERHMAIFMRKNRAVKDEEWREVTKRCGQMLCALTERQLETAVSVGIGSVRSGAEGLRKSYFEAVFASSCTDRGGKVCHFDELKNGRSSAANAPVAAKANPPSAVERTDSEPYSEHQSYVVSALQRIREEREQQTVTVLDRARQYIRERFTEEVSLEEVADFVHLNPHYFSKIFKQQVGETFIDFVTRLRIDRAKSLIAADRLSLKEVCFEVGYKDPNYFSRVFKKITGVSPSEYRGQAR
ncbi:chemotaxis protein CheY [Paenibacillus darwinianus]|uniref:Chemotaxis protein CheY n=1 Tax=Paenibacillus darwinianus TaxID=1380763 RepID=A0A9W5S1Q8_9BACL|nr:response regulator [Paenibacillus darwinianus]EXX87520.1 chemotaxis protein CheY [Paenibacillus darwinianus]EXX88410.1 chemotaxis protein CheY [Paenibacillus darwinianus]EXX88753.1 chemotaxis protein CheY [Paenibacillus darwinianus]